ncbi:McrC family protein [Spirosoma utsteinense]|uniref:5-methylcytosine-specific restriction enzyme subunit McrC n=1 Tax=Spirosoma utsteinense TaxID=2585773 RepID=A0ABR6W8H5_9BACT|nr:McrC family protein [Spirosoma utsteinense]MBC3787187.1 5-methylcytosine-specific restriction enzyme subunit McrC [Spirosoma utsteinense]MBC3792871.1 5-methylcytosine-specific restriction enzyme subunit McrC [Spirosoma utsteinense]
MTILFSVTENGLIGSDLNFADPVPGLVLVPDQTFQALRQLAFDMEGADGLLTVVVQKKRELIRIRNYVGLLPLPNGAQLEILPKVNLGYNPRRVLVTMLRRLRTSPFRLASLAHTQADRLPLWDVFVMAFLDALESLVRQGMQRVYVPVEANERFWKGTFQATRQQRENAYHAERLAVRYDALTANIPPNRILKTTVQFLCRNTVGTATRQQLAELLWALDEIPESVSIADDQRATRRMSRLFLRYEPALRWAEALLAGRAFGVQKGHTVTMSLLFPMERVFEDYVAYGIRTYWPDTDRVTVQESSAHLVDEHAGTPKFKLRPDIIIRQEGRILIMDTKWKQLTGNESGGNYGIEQADLYQLYAYGKKYTADDLFLIYPANETFQKPLAIFGYDATTRLHVVPFDPANSLADEVEKLVRYTLSV